jgi:uncharacterized protein involved in exopolysaccharide biosynthesis
MTDAALNSGRDDAPSLLGILNVVLRSWRVVAALGLLGFIAGIAYTLRNPRSYTANASFVPQGTKSSAGGVAGLAAQFGFSIAAGDAAQSPQFYADLLTSREVLRRVAQSSYTFRRNDSTINVTLVSLWGGEVANPEARLETAVDALDGQVSTGLAQKTGVITLSVTTPRPDLSRQVAQQLLENVNRFNLELRRAQAESEREFIESRLTEVSNQLRDAEANLETFLENNRDYSRAPRLTFAFDRLSREVSMRQQVYTTVSQALEQARVDAIRNTPVITVLEPAHTPVKPNPRGLVVRSILGLLAGVTLGIVIAFGRNARSLRARFSPEDVRDYEKYRGEIVDVFRRGAVSRKGSKA